MQSSLPSTADLGGRRRRVRLRLSEPGELPSIVFLITCAAMVGLFAVGAFSMSDEGSRTAAAGAALFSAVIPSVVVLWSVARRANAWSGTKWFARAVGGVGALELAAWVQGDIRAQAPGRDFATAIIGILIVAFLVVLGVEFREHLRHGRSEVVSDVALVAVVTGAALYLQFRRFDPWSVSAPRIAGSVGLVLAGVVVVAGWGVLTIWVPTRVHATLCACAFALGVAAFGVGFADSGARPTGALVIAETVAAAALLGVSAILAVESRLNQGPPRHPRTMWRFRPALLALTLCGACGMLALILAAPDVRLDPRDATILAVIVFGAVGVRMLTSQFEIVRFARKLEGALAAREAALTRLRSASETVSSSEARHRLLLDAAVDGVVELDASRTIIRANDAFSRMIGVAMVDLLGRPWEEVAGASPGADSLLSLPESGSAVITGGTDTRYLEASSSVIPTSPPGTLLLIRDVTSNKLAEQTIRTLFQFLQDRDEDRTRLLKRSNAAIEAERNRIARDLHDGPIQGISAAGLSLEAIRMMLEQEEVERAREMLGIVSGELSDEAMNLRRTMSDLRPPVLEQRGLVPAVRDLCSRLQREMHVPVTVTALPSSPVPTDTETLAYRVVQESLSNIGKHAGATRVDIRIEALSGTLLVEVTDDGRGFDPLEARDFLRAGKVGLASMRERAELAGGTFTIRSQPGDGTTVTASLPFDVLAAVSGT